MAGRYDVQSHCAYKQQFASKGAANRAIRNMVRKTRYSRDQGCSIQAYHCTFCGRYHIGHGPRRMPR